MLFSDLFYLSVFYILTIIWRNGGKKGGGSGSKRHVKLSKIGKHEILGGTIEKLLGEPTYASTWFSRVCKMGSRRKTFDPGSPLTKARQRPPSQTKVRMRTVQVMHHIPSLELFPGHRHTERKNRLGYLKCCKTSS